ncbi:MAG: carbohydrate ABC transporter permease [Actinobacteria bacterium]|nr:carbohydrate ABC transporter permease [Actinomycetota bacterium]
MSSEVVGAALGEAPERATAGSARHRGLRLTGWYTLLTVLAIVVLFPVYITVVRALSTPVAYSDARSPLYPVAIQWDVFWRAATSKGLSRALTLSAVMTLVITVAQLVTSVLAAYAFAFLRFPLKKILFGVFMATLMLPIEVTLIPNVQTVTDLGWLNTMQGLSVPFLATAFGTFLIRQGFIGVPADLRDAARLDGYGHLRFMWHVAVPLARPVIAAFTVLAFLSAWNQYLWPQSVETLDNWQTAQVALSNLPTAEPATYNVGVAGALIVALPVLVVLLAFQRQLVRGLTAGAVKG